MLTDRWTNGQRQPIFEVITDILNIFSNSAPSFDHIRRPFPLLNQCCHCIATWNLFKFRAPLCDKKIPSLPLPLLRRRLWLYKQLSPSSHAPTHASSCRRWVWSHSTFGGRWVLCTRATIDPVVHDCHEVDLTENRLLQRCSLTWLYERAAVRHERRSVRRRQ